ncbi:c-4 methyl sterol oxidase [Phaffia rhodozyma]|uniref:C-4 methyl sterol oxidase n=1 Tax=Phaffia rhodozyma TaxID=264483 RepID=A0A0F7SHL1_PHARH|nr:c-4 methyl sterol oxidase [Phaffia rhodozyma]
MSSKVIEFFQYLPNSLFPHLQMSALNATGHVTETLASSPLYQSTNLSQMSLIESWWARYYAYIGDPLIATALLIFLNHEIVYFGRSLPFCIMDTMPYFRKWKIQPTKIPTVKAQWDVAMHMLFCHFTMELPLIGGFHPLCVYLGLATHELPFPTWTKIAWQIALFFVIEDTVHYWMHRWLHTPKLYKMIHKVHHEFPAPFGLVAEYAHPLEVLILGAGTIGGPIVFCAITHDLHLFTVLVWMTLRLFQAVSAHSGYDFPWSMHNWFPLWAGAEHHDYHHMAFVNNFSSSFRHWDYFFGTDTKYHAYKARLRAAKNQAERQRLQKVEDEKAEAEGIVAANETCAKA